jgi:hypothetical protein
MTKTMLTRTAILKESAPLKRELVEIPEWGGSVYVRELSGRERDEYELAVIDYESGTLARPGMRAELAIRTVCDEKGARVFTNEDVDVVGSLSAAALGKIFDVATRLSGISAEDVKDLEGN